MTSRTDKPWPFLVPVAENSAVIADQIKCIDWRGRNCQIKGRLTPRALEQVIAIFCRLILPIER
jgi:mRNA-degrading endonuclease toxin of MazEF toxin-antitoxin module